MEIKNLIEKYSDDILDESNQERQNIAMTRVFASIVNEMSERIKEITDSNLSKKEQKAKMKQALKETNDKYVQFTAEINKRAGKTLLKPNGMEAILKKKIKF